MSTITLSLLAVAGLIFLLVNVGAVVRFQVYPRSWRGFALLVVDYTWSLINTVAGSVYLGLHLLRRHTVDRGATFHSGRICISQRLHHNYATTIGPVMAGADTAELRRHEDLHVFQARLLGPFYLPLIALNYAIFSLVPIWLIYHDHDRWPIKGLVSYFTCGVYPHVWHEAWAYRRDRLSSASSARPGRSG